MAAVVLLALLSLWLVESSRRYQREVRTAVEAALNAQHLAADPGARDALRTAQTAATQALDQAVQSHSHERIALAACLAAALLALLGAAWFAANDLSKRLRSLRESLSHLLDRGAPPAGEVQRGDEIQILSNRLHKAIFSGREREGHLRRSSEFLEFAQAAGGFGVFDLDLVTGELTGTPLFFDFIALEQRNSPFTRDEWLATIHPEDLEEVIQNLNLAISTGVRFQAEYRSLLLDGSLLWLAGRGQVLKDAEGLVARIIGTVTDITERKQLESTLHDTTASLNVAQAVAGVATMDLDFGRGRYVASENFREILGIPPSTRLDDLDGLLVAVHPDDRDQLRGPYPALGEDPSYRCEYRVVLPDGTERWIGETASVAHDRAGDLCRITGSLVDVTHLKRTEAALDSLEKRLARTMRGTRDGVWELDIPGHKAWFGPRFEELLGYGSGELEPSRERFEELIHPEDRVATRTVIRGDIYGDTPVDLEARIRHRAGHYEWVRLRAQAEH
ncbi:MAG: hypothetical protein QOG17_2095, partial [Gammaproteobacteria bacterium]|nr:hypothetical protein [Gammaproteobacteria bacterium]